MTVKLGKIKTNGQIRIADLSGARNPETIRPEHLRMMHTAITADWVACFGLTKLTKTKHSLLDRMGKHSMYWVRAEKQSHIKHGEIKFMRTTSAARNKGVASDVTEPLLLACCWPQRIQKKSA